MIVPVEYGATVVNFGTYTVPKHIALRLADQYLIWAAEYDAIADQIEAELATALTTPIPDGSVD